MFVGRKRELEALERLYKASGFQMVVLYGRRRVGKTTLIREFVKGKKSCIYTSIKTTGKRNQELFGKRVLSSFAPNLTSMAFHTMEDICSFLTKQGETDRIIIVIDEFPYFAESDKSFTSILQKVIDEEWQESQVFLILCGSSVSFMEDEVLSEKSPLYGRRTSQIKLEPFSYQEAALFVPGYTPEEKALCYGVTGGIAKYLSLMDAGKSIDENIQEMFFSKAGYMFEEPQNLLTQEFRNVSVYGAIIEAMAAGSRKVNEIADRTHIEQSSVSHALQNLSATGIVRKEYAMTDEANKKKIQYVLLDSMFRFWYRFIPDANDIIEMGEGETYYYSIVKPRLHEFMGKTFEDMCRAYTLQNGLSGKWGCVITSVGGWWGTNPSTHEETDIDVVGISKVEQKAVIGECKFKNERVDKKVLDSLMERNSLLDRKYQICRYLLFSKSGFSTWLEDNSEKNLVTLITLDEMFGESRQAA